MYIIKQIPEDFIVREISSIKPEENGRYSYFVLKKKNYTTIRALQNIAKILRVKLKNFGFAGTKDRIAVTEQLCSVKDISKKRLEDIRLKDIEIVYKGKGKNPISLGDLEGNEFEIIVRGITKKPKFKTVFINYFGDQRFSKNNICIGRAIVKKDFEKAVMFILENEGATEKKVCEYLKDRPKDFVGAIKLIPKKILMLYVHAYQAYLWNSVVEVYCRTHSKNEKIPIIGFGVEIENPEIKRLYESVLRKERLASRDFIIPQIKEISSEGDYRDLFIKAENLEIGGLEEDVTKKKKIKLKFFLKKGSYATEFIKSLF